MTGQQAPTGTSCRSALGSASCVAASGSSTGTSWIWHLSSRLCSSVLCWQAVSKQPGSACMLATPQRPDKKFMLVVCHHGCLQALTRCFLNLRWAHDMQWQGIESCLPTAQQKSCPLRLAAQCVPGWLLNASIASSRLQPLAPVHTCTPQHLRSCQQSPQTRSKASQ